MAAKRGDRVAPPAPPGGWEVRFADTASAKGWESLCTTARSNTWEAWVVLSERPLAPESPQRQHKLKRQYAEREIAGCYLEQWQYEVTSGGRI